MSFKETLEILLSMESSEAHDSEDSNYDETENDFDMIA